MDDGGGEHLLAEIATRFPEVRRVVHSATPMADLLRTIDSRLAHAAVEKNLDVQALEGALAQVLAENAGSHEPVAFPLESGGDVTLPRTSAQ
jgi:hypothetical protein